MSDATSFGEDGSIFGKLLDFLNRLDSANVWYRLHHTRPDTIMVDVASPGWRWEIEFDLQGGIDIERFKSLAGVENDVTLIEDLFRD